MSITEPPADVVELDVEDLIHRPGMYVVTITPSIAQSLLERNTNNRGPKPTAIDRYARSMAEGQWKITSQGLGISKSGVLIDGQNRLMACIQAGVPFQTPLATGLDDDARDVVDVGVRRSLADSLRMRHYVNVHALAGAVTLRMRYEEALRDGQSWGYGRRRGATNIPHEEAVEYLLHHPEMVDHTASAWTVRKVFSNVPLSVIVTFESMAYKLDPYKAEDFRNGLLTGANLSLGDPRLSLRNYLLRRSESYSRGKDSMHLLGLFIKAFNDFINGDKREVIVLKENESMPAMGARRRGRRAKADDFEYVVEDGENDKLTDSEVVLA